MLQVFDSRFVAEQKSGKARTGDSFSLAKEQGRRALPIGEKHPTQVHKSGSLVSGEVGAGLSELYRPVRTQGKPK